MSNPINQEFLDTYFRLIEFVQTNPNVSVIVEVHHILPRSMGGTDETSNLIALTPKQHYEAHYLLWKAYRNPQMTQAFHLMLWNKGDRCRVSADEYQLLKEDYSKARKLYWENLSDDDMEVFKEKSNPWKNKTEEERTEYRKRCNAWLNKSEEEMQAMKDNTAQKVKAYYANPENSEAIESWKQKRLITYHKTIANRTDEDRAKMKNKRGNTKGAGVLGQ